MRSGQKKKIVLVFERESRNKKKFPNVYLAQDRLFIFASFFRTRFCFRNGYDLKRNLSFSAIRIALKFYANTGIRSFHTNNKSPQKGNRKKQWTARERMYSENTMKKSTYALENVKQCNYCIAKTSTAKKRLHSSTFFPSVNTDKSVTTHLIFVSF